MSAEKNTANSGNVSIKIGNKQYEIDCTKIPYFESFVDFQSKAGQELVHDDISNCDVALTGVEKGFRCCFRLMPIELEAYHSLCETLEFLCVDVLQKKSIDEIITNIKAGKDDYDVECKRSILNRGNKSAARDAAFQFVYQILIGEFKDKSKDTAKVYNALNYIVSHRAVFKHKTRKIVRAAFEERFIVSPKQRAILDKWSVPITLKNANFDDEEGTTEESDHDFDYWDIEGYSS